MTLREYAWFYEGYQAKESRMWDHTASILCLLANVNSGKGKRFTPDQFHPYSKQTDQVSNAAEAEALLEKMREFK